MLDFDQLLNDECPFAKGHLFKLDGHEPVPAKNFLEFAMWMATHDNSVAQDTIEERSCCVSTVFLGMNQNLRGAILEDGSGPVLFETKIFSEEYGANGPEFQYHTWDEAIEGHAVIVDAIRAGRDATTLDVGVHHLSAEKLLNMVFAQMKRLELERLRRN